MRGLSATWNLHKSNLPTERRLCENNMRGMSVTFEPDERLTIDGDRAVWRQIDQEVVVLDTASSAYIGLNASASRLWLKLDAGATPNELSAELVAVFGINVEEAQRDVGRFIESLEERCLITAAS